MLIKILSKSHVASTCRSIVRIASGTRSHYSECTTPHQADIYNSEHSICRKGLLQSPIDIQTTTLIPKQFPPLQWSNEYSEIPCSMSLKGGRFMTLHPKIASGVPILRGGPLPGPYQLINIHYHWGQLDQPGGSEHTLNGQRYLMEVHAVHMRADLSLSAARKHPSGFAKVAYLYEYGGTPDPVFTNFKTVFHKIRQNPGSPAEIKLRFPLRYVLPQFCHGYATYMGSLTAPPCTENVIWIVCLQPRSVSCMQMRELRELSSGMNDMDDMPPITANNYRNLQHLHGRPIYYAWDESEFCSNC